MRVLVSECSDTITPTESARRSGSTLSALCWCTSGSQTSGFAALKQPVRDATTNNISEPGKPHEADRSFAFDRDRDGTSVPMSQGGCRCAAAVLDSHQPVQAQCPYSRRSIRYLLNARAAHPVTDLSLSNTPSGYTTSSALPQRHSPISARTARSRACPAPVPSCTWRAIPNSLADHDDRKACA